MLLRHPRTPLDFSDHVSQLILMKQIISSLSFKQDNTVRDEPVVDLLKYLDGVLDTAVARARLPSGVNPLNQLILIIADGRFQDKVCHFSFTNFFLKNSTFLFS